MTAITTAPATTPPPPPADKHRALLCRLDAKDRTIVRLVTLAYSNAQISPHTGYSVDQVKARINFLRNALGISAYGHGIRVRIAVHGVDSGFVPYTIVPYLADWHPERTLSSYERTIVGMIVAGQGNKKIASILGLSPDVVKYRITGIRQALGLPAGKGLRVRIAVAAVYLARTDKRSASVATICPPDVRRD